MRRVTALRGYARSACQDGGVIDWATSRDERRVLGATCFGHMMTHLYMLVFPALVIPLRAELSLSLAEALDLAFLGYLLYGLGALPAGVLSDRWSARWMLVLNVGLAGLGAVLAGLATGPTMLVAALALLGLGASIYHPAGMALLSHTFVTSRGRALGLNGVFGNIGLASAPFVTGLIAATAGWRMAYLVLGVVGIVGAFVMAVLPYEVAREESSVERTASDDGSLRGFFVLLCVAMTLGGLGYRASTVVMPAFFEARADFLAPVAERVFSLTAGVGAKNAAATTLTSLVYLVGIFGQMLGGRVADQRELRTSYLAFHLATLLPLWGMLMLSDVPLLAAAMAYIFFALGMQPVENSLVAKLTPARWRSTAYGLKFILTFGVGATAVMLVGRIESAFGLQWVYGFVAVLEVGLVLVASLLWHRSHKRLPRVANA